MKLPLQWKWFVALAVFFAALLTTIDICINSYLPPFLLSEIQKDLERNAVLAREAFAPVLTTDPGNIVRVNELAHALSRQAGLRVTVIAPDGRVIGESDKPPGELAGIENHLQRPEVQAALHSGKGIVSRHSATINADLLYVAMSANDHIVRVALPLHQIALTTQRVRRIVITATIVVALAGLPVLFWMARRPGSTIEALRETASRAVGGDLSARTAVERTGELGELGDSLNQMTHQLHARVQELSRLENMRKEFVANVSHELRTPLAIIKGYVETLLDKEPPDPATARQFLLTIDKHSRRLEALITDLLSLSELESPQPRLAVASVKLSSGIDDELLRRAAEKRIAVEIEMPELLVRADEQRLRQVFTNLLDNAIKYTQAGGKVSVSAKLTDGEAEVCVSDNGPGISPEHLPRIFERFYRADKARSRELGGTGLGLSIVKHIVQAHGGRVWAESEPGNGSRFYFTLPRA